MIAKQKPREKGKFVKIETPPQNTVIVRRPRMNQSLCFDTARLCVFEECMKALERLASGEMQVYLSFFELYGFLRSDDDPYY